ncbi:phosphogluconate dehydratase [Acidocella aminolytica]|jgi:phosphogluconate dehydratase|uniref:Phosphogluconate dehydratase n=1 Tax=Acidocella aminolytica 101 = DSM 11237 TaxID=1120923 RepID=A0A0D6PI36_9PROT|nr:phosphogluconate dehydratase [Acidocella aminolytica]GAN81317.1 phosphogluconate dehydratase [Acidocella aminolytica 101 = DSM 11237]SHE82803.1 6-phosphogluconate dehydratase [Acidocella aminolytica 101 = DSM 11237]
MVHPVIAEVTARIVERSHPRRDLYLQRVAAAASSKPKRQALGCANQAHGFAGCGVADKSMLREGQGASLGIVTAYNDMLSAHRPYETYPELIREAARAVGGVAMVAGGVPAMCDGVTQGEAGMDLSLFSRDVIALSTAVALSHNTFDAACFLGICDKIVPGLVTGALTFGHLPAVLIPAGPMPSGLPNSEKAKIRQLFAEGKVDRAALLKAEGEAYHAPGTCTFYGTANTNQMLVEIMGLHVPGSAFVNPGTPLRDALTRFAAQRAMALTALGDAYLPVGRMIDERSFVNAVVALHATGGSTNHTIHLLTMAAAGGITLTWEDLSDLAAVTPLLCRIYPNGLADVNHFHAAGGTGFLVRELLSAGLLHEDVSTVMGQGLRAYTREPYLQDGELAWRDAPEVSGDDKVLRSTANPFQSTGGLALLQGNLGQCVVKTSAVAPERHIIEAPARVFHNQEAVQAAFKAGELNKDVVVVVRFQGPKANGMPELHKLMPPLGVLQDKGFKVALVTDGRLSGASGKVLSAIHVTPEALAGGPLAKLKDGDIVRVDATKGTLAALVPEAEWAARPDAQVDLAPNHYGTGRELFAPFRHLAGRADAGATIFTFQDE